LRESWMKRSFGFSLWDTHSSVLSHFKHHWALFISWERNLFNRKP